MHQRGDCMALKDNLKRIRKAKGITQRDLATETGLSFSMISKLESGEQSNPSLETVKKIAQGLAVPVDQLLSVDQLADEITGFQALEQYLKTLGYSTSFEGPANTDDPDVVLIKGKEKTTFSGNQFKEFEKAIAASVEYQVWQQRHRKT